MRNLESVEVIYTEAPSVYGIDETSTAITFYDDLGEEQTYRVGNVDATGNYIYVTSDQLEGIYKLDYAVGKVLLTSPNEYVMCALETIETDQLERMAFGVSSVDTSLVLEKQTILGEAQWFLAEYYTDHFLLQDEQVASLIEGIESLTEAKFVGVIGEEDRYGLEVPQFVLALNDNMTYEFGNSQADQVYVKKAGDTLVYQVEEALLTQLQNCRAFAMMDKAVLNVPTAAFKTVTLANPQQEYTLEVLENGMGLLNEQEIDEVTLEEVIDLIKTQVVLDAVLANPEIEQKEERRADITIEIMWSDETISTLELIPYDINYYILRMNGTIEFAVNKDKVTKLFNQLGQKVK